MVNSEKRRTYIQNIKVYSQKTHQPSVNTQTHQKSLSKAAGLEVDESSDVKEKKGEGDKNENEAKEVETGVDFIKLHVPAKTLMKYAEILKMRMPLRVRNFVTN